MKKRMGFVSNSSASSFVIDRDYVSRKQLDHIENHIEFSKHVTPEEEEWGWCNREDDAWCIDVTQTEVCGCVDMDNFDMRHFLQAIGIPEKAIAWDDDARERRQLDKEELV